MSKVWAQEFLNSNSQRSYPLSEDATAADISGDFVLPRDFLLGLSFPVHAGLDIDPYRIFLRRVVVFGVGYNVSLGYDDDTEEPPVIATAIIPKGAHTEYDTYPLVGINDFADSIGRVVIGKLDGIQASSGAFLFNFAGGRLDPDCIHPIIRGVSSIRVRNGTDLSDRYTGDVELAAGTNCSLGVAISGNVVTVTINAISGEGLSTACECNTDDDELQPVLSINGQKPDFDGNIDLIGSDCMEITVNNGENVVRFEDVCSKPCCGCTELQTLTQRIASLGDGATTLTNVVNRLSGEVSQTSLVVLGSRLRDNGCISCE